MSASSVRMAAYAEHLETYEGRRDRHDPGAEGCAGMEDHCLIHHVDEPDNGDVYRVCGECLHVFVTEEDLQREDMIIRNQMWQAGLNQGGNVKADHSGVPTSKPGSEIYHCPLCAHDF